MIKAEIVVFLFFFLQSSSLVQFAVEVENQWKAVMGKAGKIKMYLGNRASEGEDC